MLNETLYILFHLFVLIYSFAYLFICLFVHLSIYLFINLFVILIDTDECALFTDDCGQMCINQKPGFTCYCMEGFTLQPDGISCQGT